MNRNWQQNVDLKNMVTMMIWNFAWVKFRKKAIALRFMIGKWKKLDKGEVSYKMLQVRYYSVLWSNNKRLMYKYIFSKLEGGCNLFFPVLIYFPSTISFLGSWRKQAGRWWNVWRASSNHHLTQIQCLLPIVIWNNRYPSGRVSSGAGHCSS